MTYKQTSPRTVFDEEAQCEWVYRCGWSIKGAHPYRSRVDFCNLSQPIGILCFYKETGILPTTITKQGETMENPKW